jgi:lysophospholipase L1-like esterase
LPEKSLNTAHIIYGWEKDSTLTARVKAVAAIVLVLAISTVSFLAFTQNDAGSPEELARVACVGDSITEDSGYPGELQALLGNGSVVGNFGFCGATVSANSVNPYIHDRVAVDALNFRPTAVVIVLGTNDARVDVSPNLGNFTGDYKQLISEFQALETHPKFYIVIPPPVYENSLNISSNVFSNQVVPLIKQLANETGLPLIDTYTPLLGHANYFSDGVHPDGLAAQVIAETIFKSLK